jgi:hypothetical protein
MPSLSFGGKTLTTICTLLGGFAALAVFWPRVVVSNPSIPLDQDDAFSVSLDITNTGYIPLRDVTAIAGLGQICYGVVPFDRSFVPTFNSRIGRFHWAHHELAIDGKFTITLEDLIQGRLSGVNAADIAIVVTYKPWVFPVKCEKIFRFVTYREKGRLYWRSWPIGGPPPPQ